MKKLAGLVLLVVGTTAAGAQATEPASELAATAWQLVRFVGGDDTMRTPEDRSKYLIVFNSDGTLAARIDCNRGRSNWRSPAPGQLELGPLALTRAKCQPGSLHDALVKHWPFMRSYVIRDGHLFVSLMADGGIYELEPADLTRPPAR